MRRALRHYPLLFGLLVIVLTGFAAVFPQLLAPHNPLETLSRDGIVPASAQYWLGLDHLGRDVLSRTIYGARASLLIALGSVVVAIMDSCIIMV